LEPACLFLIVRVLLGAIVKVECKVGDMVGSERFAAAFNLDQMFFFFLEAIRE
jgi:hypothetical protein